MGVIARLRKIIEGGTTTYEGLDDDGRPICSLDGLRKAGSKTIEVIKKSGDSECIEELKRKIKDEG